MSNIDLVRDALKKSTPGPWRSCAQQRHPTSDCYIKAEDGTAVVSAVMPEWARDGVAWNDAPLIALAPETAAAVVRVADCANRWEDIGASALGGDPTDQAYGMGLLMAVKFIRDALEGETSEPG